VEFFRTKRSALALSLDTQTKPLRISDSRTALVAGPRREELAPGTVLQGRYRLESVLGSGGEGVVYRAFDGRRQQPVAVKVLHVDDPSAVPLLKREFRFLRDLIHPALVPLHELVVDRELSFYSMGLITGHDFLVASSAEIDLRRHLLQLAEVLAFLHGTDRVHRDVKPSNVLVKEGGQVVLLDFGIGLKLGARSEDSTAIVGTPRYLAPEVLEFKGASPESDAYSVGIMLFEALTGTHPELSGRTELGRHERPSPRSLCPEVPRDLDEICQALLARNPAERLDLPGLVRALQGTASGWFRPQSRGDGPTASGEGKPFYAGRDSEVARLFDALGRAEGGDEPVLVMLEAPSGHGKTTTLDYFLDAQKDAFILRGRCSEHELVAHKAIDGILENLVEYLLGPGGAALEHVLEPADGEVLAQLFPELSRVPAIGRVARSVAAMGDLRALRQRAYRSLARLLSWLGEARSLIIAIDDLQWGDVDSGKLLLEVFGGAERPRCLLILAYRSEERETSRCLQEIFDGEHALSQDMVTTHVTLLPLRAAEARQLVERATGLSRGGQPGSQSSEWVDRIVDEAGGSPLLLTEIASHVRERLERAERPAGDESELQLREEWGLSEIVRERVLDLSPAARDAFELMCCAGRSIEVRLLAGLVGAEPDDTVRQLEARRLARARVGGEQLEVLHDAIREVTFRRLGPERAKLHARLATALERDGGDPAEIARHYAACGQGAHASHFAEVAADAASQSFALEHAVRLYRLALGSERDNSARVVVLREKLADALADSGLGAEAAPIYAELAERADPSHALELRRRAAEQWLITGGAAQGMAVLERVQREVGLSWPGSPAAALRTLLLERARIRLSPRRGPRRTAELPRKVRLQLDACRAAWSVSFISTIHGAANSSRYLRLALASGDREHIALGYGMEAMYLATAGGGARPAVMTRLERCKAYMDTTAPGYSRAFLKYAEGQCHYLLGECRESLAGYEQGEAEFLACCRNVSWELNSGRIFRAGALFELGEHKQLDRHVQTWLFDAQERGDTYIGAAVTMGRARRSILKDADYHAAIDEVRAGSALWVSPYQGFHYFYERICRGHVALAAQRPGEAFRLLSDASSALESSLMGRVQVARLHIRTHLAYAAIELAADARVPRERQRFLRVARAEAARMRREIAPYSTARALLLEASASMVEGPTEGALTVLRDAAARFRAIGHKLETAATEARIAEVVGGDERTELQQRARAVFSEIEACDWISALSAFAPRFLPR
jgi:hypothetical protein